jgi:hypothetical protein
MLGWAFRFGAPLFVEQSMSRVPWHLFQNLQPRAHLVVGALAEVSATDDGDELAVVQYVLKRLVSKQKPVGDFAAMKPMPKNSLQLWGLRRQLERPWARRSPANYRRSTGPRRGISLSRTILPSPGHPLHSPAFTLVGGFNFAEHWVPTGRLAPKEATCDARHRRPMRVTGGCKIFVFKYQKQ